jgi:hypothetical protein
MLLVFAPIWTHPLTTAELSSPATRSPGSFTRTQDRQKTEIGVVVSKRQPAKKTE